MAPARSNCLYENNSFRSESENDSGSDSEGGESSASGSRSSSVESANNQARQSSHGSDRSRSPSPADSQASGSSGSQGRKSRRDSASSASPQKGGDRSGRSASGSPVDEGERMEERSQSRSPSRGRKSESHSPARGSEDGGSRSPSPAEDKNSEQSRSPSPEINENRKSRSRSVGSNNSRQSSPGSRSGSGDSDNESKHSKERSESPVGNEEKESKNEKEGGKSPIRKSRSVSGSDSEDNLKGNRKSDSPKTKSQSGSPEKRETSKSPREKSGSPQEPHGSDNEDIGGKETSRKRKRAVLSDDSGSDGEKKKLDTGEGRDDGDESEKDLVSKYGRQMKEISLPATLRDDAVDAEALFGDASDISSDEEGKKRKGEKKPAESEDQGEQEEESDGGSAKAKSGEEDNEMEVDEKDDEDKENVPEEPIPETRIDVQIPKITTDLGKEIHFVKLPNFLSVETRPFDPLTYEDEIDEEETLDEEGRARLKLKVENTIRWREVTNKNGEFEKQSNARFVKWSDGSLSLHLGSEIFDVCKQPLQGDHNHLFIRQGTGLQGQAVFRTKLTFRPHSTESFTHRKMTLSLADRSQKTARIKVLSLVGKDPEAHRGELIKKEEEKLKASVRRESKQRRIREKGASRGLSAGYLEPDRYGDGDSDDEGISINAIKKQHRNKLTNPKDDRSHIYSSDEDGSDIETIRARRLDKAKALKDSDSEGSGGGGGGDKSGERTSSGED